jgi:hypothetical protein
MPNQGLIRKFLHLPQDEFCKALGILIAAAGYNCKGVELWQKESDDAFSGKAS